MPYKPSRRPSAACIACCCTLVLALSTLFSCSRRTRLPAPPARVYHPGDVETGIASWYGDPYHGRRAANGEIYDMNQYTAAHRTLPFESIVRVERLDNGLDVEVRITDRGPFVKNRIVDLSRAAAERIDLIGPGTAEVRLLVIRVGPSGATFPARTSPGAAAAPAPAAATGDHTNGESGGVPATTNLEVYAVQVGAFTNLGNAERMLQRIEQELYPARILVGGGTPVLYKVVAGRVASRAEAEDLADRLRGGYPGAMAVRIDTSLHPSFVIQP